MTTIIFTVVAIIAVILVINWYSGRSKRHSEKSGLEKIAQTVGGSIDRKVTNVAKGMRSPEKVKEELLFKLDKANKTLINDFSEYLKGIIESRELNKTLAKESENRISDLTNKAKEYKKKFEKTKEEKYKDISNRYIQQVLSNEKIKDQSEKIISECEDKIETAETNFSLMKSELAMKRSEILNMVLTPDSSFNMATLDILDLQNEFKEKLQEKNIKQEVNSIIHKDEVKPAIIVSSDEVDRRFESL